MNRQLLIALIVFGVSGPVAAQESTWDVISHSIFGDNCAGCHQAGNGFAVQSDLILTPDVAYDQLLNQPPYNEAANVNFKGTYGTPAGHWTAQFRANRRLTNILAFSESIRRSSEIARLSALRELSASLIR